MKSILKNIFFKKEKSKEDEDYLYLKKCGVETERGYVRLYGRPIISKAPNSRIVLGQGVVLVSDTNYNEAGINHPVILATLEAGAEIIIGNGCGLSGTSIVSVKKIEIGHETALGANTNIWDTDFHFCKYEDRVRQKKVSQAPSAPIHIGEHCWLASNVTVLKGVNIGNNSTIGAMSLVCKDIPANVIAVGIPARPISSND